MHDLPEATPGQLAELKLLVPKIADHINAAQMSTLAAHMDFVLSDLLSVREYLKVMVAHGSVSEDLLVDLVRTIRKELLKPSMEAEIDQSIAMHGYAPRAVFSSGDGPAFAYTIGFTGTVGFELLALAGQNTDLLAYVLQVYAHLAKSGENIELERNDIVASAVRPNQGLRTKCIPVDAQRATQDYVCNVRGEVKRVYQILIADKNNLLPDEQGYDQTFRQPLSLAL